MPDPVEPTCVFNYEWNASRKCCEYSESMEEAGCRSGEGFFNQTLGYCDNRWMPFGAFANVRDHPIYFEDNSGWTSLYYTGEYADFGITYDGWGDVPEEDTIDTLARKCIASGPGGSPPSPGFPFSEFYCRDATGAIVPCQVDNPDPDWEIFPCINPNAVWTCMMGWHREIGRCVEVYYALNAFSNGGVPGCTTLAPGTNTQHEFRWDDASPYEGCTGFVGDQGAMITFGCPDDLEEIVDTTPYFYNLPGSPFTRPAFTEAGFGAVGVPSLDDCRLAEDPSYSTDTPDVTYDRKIVLTLTKTTRGGCYEPPTEWCSDHYEGTPPSCTPECDEAIICPPNFTYDPDLGLCVPNEDDHTGSPSIYLSRLGRRYIAYDSGGAIRVMAASSISGPTETDEEAVPAPDNFRPYIRQTSADRLFLTYDREGVVYSRISSTKGRDWAAEEEIMDGEQSAHLYDYPNGGLFVCALREVAPDDFTLWARWKGPGDTDFGTEFQPLIGGVDFSLLRDNVDLAATGSDASRRWTMVATKSTGEIGLFESTDKGQTWIERSI